MNKIVEAAKHCLSQLIPQFSTEFLLKFSKQKLQFLSQLRMNCITHVFTVILWLGIIASILCTSGSILSSNWRVYRVHKLQSNNVTTVDYIYSGLWRNLHCKNIPSTQTSHSSYIEYKHNGQNCSYISIVQFLQFLQTQLQNDQQTALEHDEEIIAFNYFRNSLTQLTLLLFNLNLQLFVLLLFTFKFRPFSQSARQTRRTLFFSSTLLAITMVISVCSLFLSPSLYASTQLKVYLYSNSSFVDELNDEYSYTFDNSSEKFRSDNLIMKFRNNHFFKRTRREYNGVVKEKKIEFSLVSFVKYFYFDEENRASKLSEEESEDLYQIKSIDYWYSYAYYLLVVNFFLLLFEFILMAYLNSHLQSQKVQTTVIKKNVFIAQPTTANHSVNITNNANNNQLTFEISE